MGKNIAYVRVSTVEQNEDRQVESLKGFNIDKWFKEKVSAKDTNRPELQAMLEYVREGDTLYIHEYSRLARNCTDLLGLVELLEQKGVKFISVKEQIDTSTPIGKFILTMLAGISEFERAIIRERQAEGIAIAKERGAYKGRKPVEVEQATFTLHYTKYLNRELNKKQLAEALGVSRPTLDKMIEEYKNKS